MTKWLNAFLELKNEDEGTKKFTLLAVFILTFGLAFLSISGAFAKSDAGGEFFALNWIPSVIPRVAYACVVLGLELLAAVLFMRAMRAQDRVRMAVCLAVLPFLVWANVQNAKDGLHFIMPNTFGESSVVLNAKADLAAEEAVTLQNAQDTAVSGTGEELERVRTQIAELKTEQQIMASMSPEGISKAQSLLLAQGLYFGSVDGIRQDKTESAMRARGEAIQGELATLKAREDGLMQGQASPVMRANTNKRIEEITQRDKARVAADAELRAEIIFWVAEFARNLLLWAAVTSVTATAVAVLRRREDELAELEHQNRLAALRAQPTPAAPAPEPEPVAEPIAAVAPEPEPLELTQPAPPPSEMTTRQRSARQAGLETQQQRRAAKAEKLLTVGDWEARDADMQAARMAAQ
jgi:hypothetical protein